MATAPIPPLAWVPPYAAGAALKKTKRQKKKKKKSSSYHQHVQIAHIQLYSSSYPSGRMENNLLTLFSL